MSSLFMVVSPLVVGIASGLVFTPFIIRVATRFNITAKPWNADRNPIPLMGGVSIFISFLIGIIVFSGTLFGIEDIRSKYIIGMLIGVTVLVVGGVLDDKYSLPAKKQFIFPIIAILVVIVSGIGVTYVTNPFSPEKLIYLDTLQKELFTFRGIPYRLTLPADILTFVWLAVIMYSTKLQD